jgi:peptidoglycan hydrolase-like protein with peptidoglycan-binding domain
MSARIATVPALLLAVVCAAVLAPTAAAGEVEVLKRGSRGPAVVQLQQKLGVPADGAFGPQTARAVRRFQARRGLVVDGVVGPQTAQALGLSLAEVRTAARAVRIPPALARIAQCESGGNPRAVSPDGTYRGKYQFDRATWRAMGGSGDPARASEAEQDRRALALFRARGAAPWPACAG